MAGRARSDPLTAAETQIGTGDNLRISLTTLSLPSSFPPSSPPPLNNTTWSKRGENYRHRILSPIAARAPPGHTKSATATGRRPGSSFNDGARERSVRGQHLFQFYRLPDDEGGGTRRGREEGKSERRYAKMSVPGPGRGIHLPTTSPAWPDAPDWRGSSAVRRFRLGGRRDRVGLVRP